MKHKHADVIKAWADGAQIQYFVNGQWWDLLRKTPAWDCSQYRIKPAYPRDEQTDDHTGICMEVEA